METRNTIQQLQQYLQTQVIGQEHLVECLIIALLADGHILVEGAPGLAKTRAIRALSAAIESDFHRIQFTPDLLPSDITGTDIYRPENGTFQFQPGPIFHNLILVDEINRAPAKVQSALLEAMAERQVSVGMQTYPLSEMFLVMATQNPIEQEGTYRLPEAQLDRFLLHVKVDYPQADTERAILQLVHNERRGQSDTCPQLISKEVIFAARQEILQVHIAEAIETYIVHIVMATRGKQYHDISQSIIYGVSPRGTISLRHCAAVRAWLRGRDYITPEDVQAIAPDVLRHRIILSFEAEAENETSDSIITRLIQEIPVA